MRSYEWITKNFEKIVNKYAGKCIAVIGEEVVAVGDSPKIVEDEAMKKYPNVIPSVMRVPRAEDLACLL
ncbi:MAG: DUF5678 domain-containing protein [Methanosarcinales archaeon]